MSFQGHCVALLRWLDHPVNQTSESAHIGGPSSANARPVAPEWELVLAASCADPRESDLDRIRGLLDPSMQERPVEWEAIVRLADHHGTSALLYQNLSRLGEAAPAAVLAALRQSYERNVHKSLFLARELIRILDCLDAIGIEVIPYKGIVLSEVYYGDMALRQSGDMDLFVRGQDVARIKHAVRELGYTLRVPIPEDAEENYIASGYEYTFDSSAGNNLLELQWALQPRFYAVDFDMDGLFERAVNVTVAGRRVKDACSRRSAAGALGACGETCLGTADLALRHRADSEAGKFELGLGAGPCTEIWHRADSARYAAAGEHASGKGIPAPIEESVLADRAARAFADEIAVDVARGVTYEEQQISYFRLMMRLRESWGDRLRFLARLTFTPGPGEWEAVRLPKPLFPLYRLVRLARLASRFARG